MRFVFRNILSALLLFNMIPESSTFLQIAPVYSEHSKHSILPINKMSHRNHHILCAHNTSNMIKTNRSKVYKMNYKSEEEELFEPKYAFGLNEYTMIMIRIFVYTYITAYIIMLYLEKYL